jgi:hypothetical protein
MHRALSPSPVVERRLAALVAVHATLALGYLGHLAQGLASRAQIVSTDFTAYYTGFALVLGGARAHLYEPAAQAAAQARILFPAAFPGGLLAFLNPPHVAVAFAPFALLGLSSSFRLWTALELALAVLVVRAVLGCVRPRTRLERWVVVTAVAGFWPVFYAVQVGQLSLLLTLALLRLGAAVDEMAEVRAGLWLFVLTSKPQLLPLIVVFLAAHGRWRALGVAAAATAGAVLLSSAILGWRIWASYLANLPALERFFGQGTANYMVSWRGLLELALGPAAPGSVAAAARAALVVGGLVATGAVLFLKWRRERAAGTALDRRFALAVALALILCPHLFIQDVALWIAPLAVFAGMLRDQERPEARAFVRFVLAWPLAFAAVGVYVGLTGRSPAALALVPLGLAVVTMARTRSAPASSRTASGAGKSP